MATGEIYDIVIRHVSRNKKHNNDYINEEILPKIFLQNNKIQVFSKWVSKNVSDYRIRKNRTA